MDQKYTSLIGIAALVVGIAVGYSLGVRQTVRLLGRSASPVVFQNEALPATTVDGYKNPFAVYKNPFRK